MKKILLTSALLMSCLTLTAKEISVETSVNPQKLLLKKPSFNLNVDLLSSHKTIYQCLQYCHIVEGLPSCAPFFGDECLQNLAECIQRCRNN